MNRFNWILVVLSLIFLTVVGTGAVLFFVPTHRINTNKNLLSQYLTAGKGTVPGKNFDIKVRNEFIKTDDCVSQTQTTPTIFCFNDVMIGNTLKITVFPNLNAIKTTDPNYVNKALNLSLFNILERNLGLDPTVKYTLINIDTNPVFIW